MRISNGDYVIFKGFGMLTIGYNHDDGVRCLPYYYKGDKLHHAKRDPTWHLELKKKTRFDHVFQDFYVFLEEDDMDRIYFGEERLEEILSKSRLTEPEEIAADFATMLMDEAGLKESEMGIYGSLLLGKEKVNDIDFGIYGIDASMKAIEFLKSDRFEFPMEQFLSKKRFLDPVCPVTRERYAPYVLYKGMLMDMFYKFGRIELEYERLRHVGKWEGELMITDASLRLFKPTIYRAVTKDDETVEILSHATYLHYLENDVVHFSGRMFERNGRKVMGVLNPNIDKLSTVMAREELSLPNVAKTKCSEA